MRYASQSVVASNPNYKPDQRILAQTMIKYRIPVGSAKALPFYIVIK